MLVVSKRAVRLMKNDQKYTQIPNLKKSGRLVRLEIQQNLQKIAKKKKM
jgi:hypothetical protein